MGGLFETSILQGEMKNNYIEEEILDYNAYGVIHKCKDIKSNKMVALKIINKKYLEKICGQKNLDNCLEIIRKKIEYLRKMEGDYSLQLIEGKETNEYFYIVTEIWDTNSEKYLLDKKTGLSFDELKYIFEKLNIALKRMVENKIIHVNLNLSNILIKINNDEIIPLLSDYGKKGNLDEKLNIMESTSNFSAPEILLGENYDYKADLWSVGVILYRLYFDEFPFNGDTQVALYNDIKKKKNLKKSEKNILFNDLIRNLLMIDPNKRMTWDEYFNHKFWESNKKKSGVNENEYLNYGNKNVENEKKEYKYLYKNNKNSPNNKYYSIYYNLHGNTEEETKKNNLEGNKKIEIVVEKGNKDELIDNLIYQELTQKVQIEYLSKLILYGCNLNNIDFLTNLQTIYLLELDLSRNQINNILPLSKTPFNYLSTLNLSSNNIDDISPLKNASFVNLRNLNFAHNIISDIEPLSKFPFYYLDKLKLTSNKISNIDTFTNVPFTYLTYLNLSNNKITESAQALAYISINNLQHLDLSHNSIKSILGLNAYQYKNLQILNLGDNDINNIDLLKEVYFSELAKLSLYDNNIDNANVFSEAPFINLKELNLSYNNLANIDFINNVTFKNLEKLDLNGNKINDLTPLNQFALYKLKELELKYNKLKDYEGNYVLLETLKMYYTNLKILYN